MNIFSRIAIGTAAWGHEYNGVKVPEKDIKKILGMAQCSGIDTLDCATAYGWDWNQANSYFNKIIKVRKGDDIYRLSGRDCDILMAHNACEFPQYPNFVKGISIYEYQDLNYFQRTEKPKVIQVPYSLYDRRFEERFLYWNQNNIEIHVRSIFLRGKIIQDGIPAEECIKFCLANPYIDKIIIGADSFDQFRRNLDFIFKWNNLEKHDEKLLDPRKW